MFMQARSAGIRLWHWLDAGVVFALLGTVLLRNTLISPRDNATLIREKIEGAGAAVTADQARAAARALNDNLWAWHVYLGYALTALVLFRGVVLLLDSRKPAAPHQSRSLYYRVVKGFHKSFYVALVIFVVTGLTLVFKKALSLGKPVENLVHGIHENLMWFVIAFVVGHIAGVIRAELGEDRGLISQMIHGKDAPPP